MFRRILPLSFALAALFGCSQDLSPLNIRQSSYNPPAPPPPPPASLLDGFDLDPGRTYWGAWGPMTMSMSGAAAVGTTCLKFARSASTTFGSGAGFSYVPAGSFPGATSFDFYVKVDANVTIQIYWTEGPGTDGDDWMYNLVLTANPAWQHFTIPFSSFSTGDGSTDYEPQSVGAFWFDSNNPYIAYGAHTLYFDHLSFY